MRITITVAASLFCCVASAAQSNTLERRMAVEEAIRRANDYFQANYSIGNEGWERSTYQTGNFRAWETLGVQAYFDRAVAWGEANGWDHGTDYGDWNGASADAHCCGQTYIDLYKIDPQPVRTNIITGLLDELLLDNRPASIDDWWWIDAFYMAGSTLARLGMLNSDTNYLNQMNDMYEYMKHDQGGGLFNAAQGLWWRDPNYKSSAPDVYWGRGNGWVIASCARVLEQLPEDDTTYRPEFESMLRTMAAALLPWQQSDGFWRSSITHPEVHPNPETSGTAFFTYAIAYGLNEGILVDSPGTNYTAAVSNAWYGLTTIALHPSGKLGYTQAVGSDPRAATYDSERDYGCGAFLLAGCEILRMLGGPVPFTADAGADLNLVDADADYAEPVMLSASNSVLRSGTIEGYGWWSGDVFLGSGPELNVVFPLGTNTVTLKVEHSDGNTYADERTIKVSRPGIAATASGSENSVNTPDKTLDGNLGTRWAQEGADGTEWIQYELPQTSVLDRIQIAFFNGNTRRAYFDVRISTTGTNAGDFATVVAPTNSSGNTLDLQTFVFPAQPAKYVRIHGYGNSASSWNSFTEVSIPIPPQATDHADSDANGLPDSWEIHYLGTTGQVASIEIGGTGITLEAVYVLGLDPVAPDTTPMIGINVVSNQPVLTVQTVGAFGVGYQGLVRKYSVLEKTVLTNSTWTVFPGYDGFIGDNLPLEIGITNTEPVRFFQVETWLE